MVASDDTRAAGSSLRGADVAGPASHNTDNRTADVGFRQFDHTTIDREVVIVLSLDSCHSFGCVI